jgi:hypothetical protein
MFQNARVHLAIPLHESSLYNGRLIHAVRLWAACVGHTMALSQDDEICFTWIRSAAAGWYEVER